MLPEEKLLNLIRKKPSAGNPGTGTRNEAGAGAVLLGTPENRQPGIDPLKAGNAILAVVSAALAGYLGYNYLNWEKAAAQAYRLQVSQDGTTWTDVYSTTTGSGGIEDLGLTPVDARYVRMYGTQRNSVYGYSLWEMEVYGAP